MKKKYNPSQNKRSCFMSDFGNRPPLFARKKRVIIFLLEILFSSISFAQQENITKKNDSVNNSLIQSFNKKLSLIERQRISDSIKRAELESQILSLKKSDN